LDIVAFASLAQVYFIDKEVQYSLRDYMQESCPNLVGHVNRMKERYVAHVPRLVIPGPVFLFVTEQFTCAISEMLKYIQSYQYSVVTIFSD
jgi:predicted ATP-dependent Lon-type protease